MPEMLLGDVVSPTKIIRKGDKEVPFLSMSKDDGLVIEDSNASNDTLESSKIVKYGQLVIGLHMDEGSIWAQNITEEGAVSRAYDVLDVKSDLIDLDYLNYALHTDNSMQYYRDNGVGSTIRRSKVPWESLKMMPIKVPNLEYQKKSVDYIKRAQRLNREIHLALDMIDGMESSLFNNTVKESRPVMINEIAELTFGRTPGPDSGSSKEMLTYVSGASDFGEVFTKGGKKVASAERTVGPDSILMTVRDPVGKVNITSEECAIGRGIVGITPKEGASSIDYLYLALREKRQELNALAYGIIKSIGPKEVNNISINCISIDEQNKMSESFRMMEKVRATLQKMLLSIDILYQKILQERFECSVIA